MTNFGLFDPGGAKPLQEYEGEHLTRDGDTVSVMANDDKGTARIVAVIRLAERQSVKKITK